MSEECTHDCGSCGADCPSRGQAQPESLLEKPHAGSAIKKVIAVVSGKGGVGKSLVTSLMAVNMRRAVNIRPRFWTRILPARPFRKHLESKKRRPETHPVFIRLKRKPELKSCLSICCWKTKRIR